MPEQYLVWLSEHYVELLGSILGLVYIFFSIRQHIFTWPVGLLTSALYVYVFFSAKFYADMMLQVYYVAISIYGWYHWLKGSSKNKTELVVSRLPRSYYLPMIILSILLSLIFIFGLQNYTDSPVPIADSITTAFSILATWMLARKYVEHWLIWIFVDAFSVGLYVWKGLWPTAILFVIYTGMAIFGYINWRKDLKQMYAQVA